MPYHNMFSIEVATVKTNIRQLGYERFKNTCKYYSYKEQALKELSMRLFLEEENQELRQRIKKLITENEMLKG